MTQEVEPKVEVKELSPVLQELQLAIPWNMVEKSMNGRFNELRKKARPIKGFRKGKAPRWLLEQLYGPQVQAEVSQRLLTDALTQALIKNELAPVATPEIEPGPFNPGSPLEFTVRIEVRPKFTDIKYEGLELERPVEEVSNDDVDQEIERLREEAAAVITVEPPRPSKDGDVLVIDTKIFEPDNDEPERTTEDQEVEIGKGLLLEQVEEALVGVSVGETKTVTIDVPQAPDDDKEPKHLDFHITVKEIKEKLLPALDDGFAKDVSEHETLLELRLGIRKDLEKRAASTADDVVKDKLLDALCDANPVEVPPSLVEQQLLETQQEVARMLQMDLERQPFSEEQTDRMKEQGERKVRAALLLTQIARDAEIEVSEEAVEERLGEIAEQTEQPLPKVKAQFGKGEMLEQLQMAMLQQHVVEHILSKATIVDVPQEKDVETGEGEPDEAPQSSPDEERNGEDHDEA